MNVSQRLQRLEEKLSGRILVTVFKLEGGGKFQTECDPLSYLIQNGVETPQGRIVGIELPEGNQDPITASLYEAIEQMIKEPGEWTLSEFTERWCDSQ